MGGDWFAGLVVEGPLLWKVVFWCGVVAALVASLWMLLAAFGEGVAWGIGVLLIPIIGLAFIIAHWDKARGPFGMTLVAWALILLPQRFAGPPEAEAVTEPAAEDVRVYGGGQVYRYTDRFGRVHITDDLDSVPAEYRDKVDAILE